MTPRPGEPVFTSGCDCDPSRPLLDGSRPTYHVSLMTAGAAWVRARATGQRHYAIHANGQHLLTIHGSHCRCTPCAEAWSRGF